MAENIKTQIFDIVFITGLARSTYSYLPVIKELSKKYSVAVFKIPLELPLNERMIQDDSKKTIQEKFLELCSKYGATILNDQYVDAKLTIFPQMKYLPESKQLINKYISTRKKTTLMNFPRAGVEDEFIFDFDISTLFVINRAFFDFQLLNRKCVDKYKGRTLIEIGHPFIKHPLFPDFKGDYMIAIPTVLSFPHEKDKWQFFETVLSLFEKIPKNDTIIYKEHNGQKSDTMAPLTKRQEFLMNLLSLMPYKIISRLLKKIAKSDLGIWSNRAARFYTYYLYNRINKRVTPLSKLNPNHYLALEVFLPGIRKGVIGGLSNSIWQTLYYKLPFYNCVDIESQQRNASDKLYTQDAKKQLEFNLQFFFVPYCKGNLDFDSKYFKIVSDECRNADFVESIEMQLESA